MKNKQYLILMGLFLAVFTWMGIDGAKAPVDQGNTAAEPTALPAAEQPRLKEGAQVYQTMLFTRCGHSVSRRTEAADAVREADFEAVRDYYDLWTVLALSEDSIEMERKIDLFCPMHKVLSLNEAGQVVLAENRYGDGMAILTIYENATVQEKDRNTLLAGQGFDSRQEAESWLQERNMIP